MGSVLLEGLRGCRPAPEVPTPEVGTEGRLSATTEGKSQVMAMEVGLRESFGGSRKRYRPDTAGLLPASLSVVAQNKAD